MSWLEKQRKLQRQNSSSSIPTTSSAPKEQKPIIEIYTDWANHYLDKLKGRTKIKDLETELSDGLVLADVIEAVTNQKVPDVVRKPGKNAKSQINNIQASLNFLNGKGIRVDDIRASDIHAGSLKAILGLFFQLSRFKQQQKLQQQQGMGVKSPASRPPTGNLTMTMTLTTTQNSPTSIPSPTKRPTTAGRLTAPTTPTKVPTSSSIKPPKPIKFDKIPISSNHQQTQLRTPRALPSTPDKRGLGKRTSSSSGFSSPRSISSSVSSNVSSDTNFPSPSALRRINNNGNNTSSPVDAKPSQSRTGPFLGKSKLPSSSNRHSPKRSPKFSRANVGDTEIKDYGLIDTKTPTVYPPHAGGKTFIATPTAGKIPKVSGIPMKQQQQQQQQFSPACSSFLPQGCTVRPLQTTQTKPLEEPPTPVEVSSSSSPIHSKTCSLPRRRREDSSPGPSAVAVVSPMPSSKNNSNPPSSEDADSSPKIISEPKERKNSTNEEEEDFLKNIIPMKPLGIFSKPSTGPNHHLPFGSQFTSRSPAVPPLAVNSVSIQPQEGGILRKESPRSVAVESGYMSDGGDAVFNNSYGSIEDGYMSEGGMSFYARKLQSRRGDYLPDVINSDSKNGSIYRVIGGRKHVQKSESGSVDMPDFKEPIEQHYDWKKAMAHNARILSSQEKAMDEYLRRQRAVAEQQLHLNKDSRHRSIGTKEDGRGSSIPGTPVVESRRNNYCSSLERNNKSNQKLYSEFERTNAGVASPMSSRKNFSQMNKKDSGTILGSRSLPKGTSSLNYGLMLDRIHQKRQHRPNPKNDGSLSDSNYAAYSEIQGIRGGSSSPYSWLQPASTYANSVADPYSAWNEVSSSEAMGSTESLNSVSSSIQQARLSKARLMMMQHQQKISPGNPHRRNLNKARSEASAETEYYGIPVRPPQAPTNEKFCSNKFKSQPTSPTSRPGFVFASTNYNGKDQSSGGMVYAPSSIMTKEERTNNDIIKLRKELEDEHDKVRNLTSQLATNSHVVAAFQQSLSNMSNRLHQLTTTAEKKDSELSELRATIEKLRQSGIDVGLISDTSKKQSGDLTRQISSDSFLSDDVVSDSEDRPDGKKKSTKRSGWLRHSFSKAFSRNHHKLKSKGGSLSDAEDGSITKALYENDVGNPRCSSAASIVHPEMKGSQSSSAIIDGNNEDVVSDLKRQLIEKDELLTETRLEALTSAHQLEALRETVTKMRAELQCLKSDNDKLNGLVSNRGVVHKSSSSSSISSSRHSIGITEEGGSEEVEEICKRRHSATVSSESSMLSGLSSLDLSSTTDPTHKDGGKIVSVSIVGDGQETRIGVIAVSGKSTWDLLESLIQRLFKEYVMRVDPVSNLGLGSDSISHYHVGEIRRSKRNSANPEMLPYGYLVGDTTDIKVYLRKSCNHVDSLAFETLIPKSLIQRYVSLLMEHRRIILSGPAGTGKTFIAKKLANYLVQRKRESVSSPVVPNKESVTIFTVTLNNVNDLRQYLVGISQKCSAKNKEGLPTVIVLDNLHLAGKLDEIFNGFLTVGFEMSPYIIGTLNQSTTTAATTSLQLQHNFRWILCANHMEPVRGFLGRYLRRKLLVVETSTRTFDAEMSSILDWVAKVYTHLNKFLETHSSCGDITFGPKHFLDCPVDATSSRNWFVNLWNQVIIPHMTEVLREAIQLYGKRASWEDPLNFVKESWPWNNKDIDIEELSRIKPEDVGYDLKTSLPSRPSSSVGGDSLIVDDMSSPGGNSDPLFNMLMHLQEAAANNESKRNRIDEEEEEEEDKNEISEFH